MTSPSTSYFCWICGTRVDLCECKTDEHGLAVHEVCYTVRLALNNHSPHAGSQRPTPSN